MKQSSSTLPKMLLGLKSDSLFLLLAVLLDQIHPLYTILCYSAIVLRHISSINHASLLTKRSFLLVVVFFCFGYCSMHNGLTCRNVMWLSFPSILAFLSGYVFFKDSRNQHQIIFIFLLLAIYMALPHLYITFLDIFKNGLINPERHLLILVDEDESRSVTARTVELSLAISGISFFFGKKLNTPSNIQKCFLVLSILAMLCVLHYVSRTGIALFLIAVILGYFYKGKLSVNSLLSIVVIFVVFYLFTKSSFYSIFESREIAGSNIENFGGRTERWSMSLGMLLEHTGGYVSDGYAHNFWLDFARHGGIISFVFLIWFSFLTLITSIKIQFLSSLALYDRLAILLYSLIFISTLFTEPVHTGASIYMYNYFLFSGFIEAVYKYYKDK